MGTSIFAETRESFRDSLVAAEAPGAENFFVITLCCVLITVFSMLVLDTLSIQVAVQLFLRNTLGLPITVAKRMYVSKKGKNVKKRAKKKMKRRKRRKMPSQVKSWRVGTQGLSEGLISATTDTSTASTEKE